MTNRTHVFLDTNLGPRKKKLRLAGTAALANAGSAEKAFGLPLELWTTLTAEFRARDGENSQSWKRCQFPYESALMMGLAIGWYEATRAKKQR